MLAVNTAVQKKAVLMCTKAKVRKHRLSSSLHFFLCNAAKYPDISIRPHLLEGLHTHGFPAMQWDRRYEMPSLWYAGRHEEEGDIAGG